jgi:dinuclear metal center YbgI/SA1388 family protein
VRLHATAALLEEIAPSHLVSDWDNSGWQIRLEDAELRGMLVALDPVPATVEEAAAGGLNLLVTHHPLLFRAPRALDAADLVGATAIAAIRRGVSIISLHTNLDAAPQGTSWALARKLGLPDGRVLEPRDDPEAGVGYVARATTRRSLRGWAEQAERALGQAPLALSGDLEREHEVVAVMGGSGASLIPRALADGATLLLTADVRYHEGQQALAAGLSLIVLDHYASEAPVLEQVALHLRQRLPCQVELSRQRTTPWEAYR